MQPSLETLHALRDLEAPWYVSITMPTARGSEAPRRNVTRLRRCLDEARRGLETLGAKARERDAALAVGGRASDDPTFWNPSARGLALFLTPNGSVTDWLPVPVPEQVAVGPVPRLFPLFSALAPESKFFVLALAAHDVRFFEASRSSVRASLPEGLPRHVDEATWFDEPPRAGQVDSGEARQSSGTHCAPGLGEVRHLGKEERLARFIRKVDEALWPKLKTETVPLVLAGDVTVTAIFRGITQYAHVLPEAVDGNPEPLRGEELRDRAWPLLEPLLRRRAFEALEHLRELAGSGRTAHELSVLERVAQAGGIESLFLSPDVESGNGTLDRLLLHATAAGAAVHFIERGQLPDGHAAGAILRKGHEYWAAAS